MSEPPMMRVRVWIDGEVLIEEAFPPLTDGDSDGNTAAHSITQMRAIVDADNAGKLWMIEVFDPSEPRQQPFRFGTDTTRMGNPVELPEP